MKNLFLVLCLVLLGCASSPKAEAIGHIAQSTGSAPDASDVMDSGDLDVEGSFRALLDNINGGADGDFVAFSATTTDGTASLRFTGVSESPYVTWILKVRGADVLNNQQSFPTIGSNLPWLVGDDVRWRAWYRPSLGTSGIRIWVNGVAGLDVVGTTTGGALAEASALSFGGNPSAVTDSERMIAHPIAELPETQGPEIVCMGDSTLGRINPGNPEVVSGLSYFYLPSERLTRPGVALLAVGADTLAGQKAKWLASWWRTQASVKVVTIQVGINDILAGTSSATIITNIQGLVDLVKRDRPDVKVAVAELTPIKTALDNYYSGTAAAKLTVWEDVNESLLGSGGSPITGVDYRIRDHVDELDDGTGALKVGYDYDYLHPNNAGRKVESSAYRTAVSGLGFLR